MELIHFCGLNCYHGCIINAANFLEVNYQASLSSLWSETDFSYDSVFCTYLTKRMPKYLETLGITLQKLPCSSMKETGDSISSLAEGTWFTVGMDAFFMPWNQYYKKLNGYHYFLAQKKEGDLLCCFDPTYNQKDIWVKSENIIPHAFDIVSIGKGVSRPMQTSVIQEAHNILNAFTDFQQELLKDIRGCTGANRKKAEQLGIFADALHTNRCLYNHHLHSLSGDYAAVVQLFSEEFLKQWISIKNGLYKASLIFDNEDVLEQVCKNLTELMDKEMATAEILIISE